MMRTLIAAALGVTLVAVLAPTAAHAVATTVFDQPFHDNTANGTGAVAKPALPGVIGTNIACLTASGNTSTGVLRSCPTSTDAPGSGTLRLTDAVITRQGGVFGATSIAFATKGVDVTFNAYQYGGSGADGIAFAFAATDPASPASPSAIGQGSGALGYSSVRTLSQAGLVNAYLGIGLDVFGSFSSRDKEGTNCSDPAYISPLGTVPGQVLVRGPGSGSTGYCAINSTATNTSSPALPLRAATRAASTVPVEVVLNPTTGTILTPSGLSVPTGQYKIQVTLVGGVVKTLSGALPTVPAGLYPSSTWLTAGIPKQLTFGWTAASGLVTDFHEVDDAVVITLDPAPVLSVSQTSYTGSSPQPGDPVTYTVAASVAAGTDEPGPITVVETVPSGVVPLVAYGSGWVCQTPVGQSVTCTNNNGPFANGAALTPIQVVAIVTGGSVTPALIQSGSTATASAADAVPGVSSSTTAGTLPTTPGSVTASPTSGTTAGGTHVVVGGTNITGATAIEIGTTAEFLAGTPTTLVPCPAGSAPGCFTVAGSTLDISSMSAHALGAVQVKVVTQGVAGVVTYTYVGTLALTFGTPPAGQVGVAYTDTLTATGGMSPLTWSVSAGSLPPGLTLGATTGVISGTPTLAGTFSFTVRVADAGTQTATQPTSLTVAAGLLSITTPPTANLGTAASGSPGLSASLGAVTVTDNRGSASASWAVTVSSTTFTTGAGTPSQTVAVNMIAYSSGAGTVTGTGTFVPGSLANGSLPGTGASWTGGTAANSVTWNPTLAFTFLPSQVAGTYTGVITHSVA